MTRRARGLDDRQSIRLRGWDYRRVGWYFVTIGTWGNIRTLARVERGTLQLTRLGRIVDRAWHDLPQHHSCVMIDAFVVMPNHIHGIVVITRFAGSGPLPERGVAAGSLGAVVRSFKASVTREVHRTIAAHLPVWHRNYHERILRDRQAIAAVRRYIANNPARWIAERGGD